MAEEKNISPHSTKTYRYYSIGPSRNQFSTSFHQKGILYIGNNTHHIALLEQLREIVRTTADPETALNNLKQSNPFTDVFPNVIIVEDGFGIGAIKKLSHYLNSHRVLCQITFVVAATHSSATLPELKKNAVTDEVLLFNELHPLQLQKKLEFLGRMKKGILQKKAAGRLEAEAEYCDRRCRNKRMVDIIVSSVALVILSPLFLLIALAIKLESRGPILYISPRAGRGYQIFNFLKFRTMYKGADLHRKDFLHLNKYDSKPGPGPLFFKFNNDPRITRVGHLLRKTSLDEIPQLFNVLKGDMSLVGNRPLPLYEAVNLTTDEWAERWLAPAGMISLWHVRKMNQHGLSAEERIATDIDYARNHNFLTDLLILLKTPLVLLHKGNA